MVAVEVTDSVDVAGGGVSVFVGIEVWLEVQDVKKVTRIMMTRISRRNLFIITSRENNPQIQMTH
jgi:hypothetical protein